MTKKGCFHGFLAKQKTLSYGMDNETHVAELARKNDANLDALIQEIGRGNVVPIIGTDLIKVRKDGKEWELMEYILEKLETKYDTSRFKYLEHNCLSPFEKLNHLHSVVTRDKLGFYTYITDIMQEVELMCDTTSFDQLAKIRKFKLFINASFTNILQQSVKNNRNAIANKLDVFSLDITHSPLEDIVIESSINSIAPVGSPQKLKKTVVYNLYGKYGWEGDSFVVVDDDILELVHTINTNRDKLKTLYELLSSSSLLFIGCNFPDWLLRLFIRMFSKQKLSVSSSLYSVADVLNSEIDRNRAIFIQNSSIKYFESNGNAFIDRLYNKILSSRPRWIRAGANYIFLSYATDNQVTVLDRFDDLENSNFDVFIDVKSLDFGNMLTPDIKTAIDKCKIFMPVISKETDSTSNNSRFFKLEWDYVLDLQKRQNPENDISKRPVILPVFLNQLVYNEIKKTTPKLFFDLKYQGANAENGFSKAFIEAVRQILEQN